MAQGGSHFHGREEQLTGQVWVTLPKLTRLPLGVRYEAGYGEKSAFWLMLYISISNLFSQHVFLFCDLS